MFQIILYLGSSFFQSFPSLGNLTRSFYLKLLLPLYFSFISWVSKVKFRVIYRHSVLSKNFNPCLSDIDYSVIVDQPSEAKFDKLVECLGSKFKLKILDIPQIYLKEEWPYLPDIDDEKMRIVRFIWYFRKQSWINKDIPASKYERLKKSRSNKMISAEIFKSAEALQNFKLSDLKLDFPVNGGVEVCFYSPYLELKDQRRVLICSLKEFEFLMSILPFERPLVDLDKAWLEVKKDLWKFEYYVSRSHYRVHSRLGEDCHRYKPLLRILETEYQSIFGEQLSAAGERFDYTG